MFGQFKQRSDKLERLDTGDYTTAQYAHWQKEMRFIHRIFGEMRALKATLYRTIEASENTRPFILDVGAGSGELLGELGKWVSNRHATLVGVEINTEAARSIRDRDIFAIQSDALHLPFADNSFDYAFCSLFLHHLDDKAAAVLLREMARVVRGRIFVIDLNRHPTAYYVYKIVGWPFLQRFTLDDGALSILRSRTPDELRSLAETAGLRDILVEHSRVNRLVLSGAKAANE